MSDPLYAVPFPIQKPQIDAWCWGSCGKGLCGAINIDVCMAVPCNEAACPHLERQADKPLGDVDGRPVYLRKLLPV